jgi:hypothetical protein
VLAELEQRLSDVLGGRLDAPFTGRTAVAGDAEPTGTGPIVRVRTRRVRPRDPDFGAVRPERAPGATDPRRVVRLECELALDIVPGAGAGRSQVLAGLDQLLFLVDGPDFRNGSALIGPPDPGFLLESLRIRRGTAAVDAESEDAGDGGAELVLVAIGWFWPPGTPGGAGEPIEHALVRQLLLPLRLSPVSVLAAGSDPLVLSVSVGRHDGLEIDEDQTTGRPFGALAFRLVGRGGRPGAGTLSGGTAGPGGARVVDVVGDTVTVTYTPPDGPALDHLVVAPHTVDTDGQERIGSELARFPLEVVG